MRKVFIVNSSYDYERMFEAHGWMVVSDVELADLIQFTGGEDVHPSFYDERPHQFSFSNIHRDNYEIPFFQYGITNSIPMAGICRGGQFLNVMNGGRMYQHVSKHTGSHKALYAVDGREVYVTSTHHQMMRPGPSGEVFLTAQMGGMKEFMPHPLDPSNKPIINAIDEDDVEGVFYPNSRTVCFQPHPEFRGHEELATFYFEVINKFLF